MSAMTDLQDRFRSLDRVPAPDLWLEATQRSAVPESGHEWRFPPMNRFAPLALGISTAAVAILIGIALLARAPNIGPAPSPANPSASAAPCSAGPAGSPVDVDGWSGPVRPCSSVIVPRELSREEGDSPCGYVDIERVQVDSPSQTHWRLFLAEAPPKASTLDPARIVISYGLTFDTTGDGEADYVVGISNDAPRAGDYRVWVTDLATGETDEQMGPPYGYPIEFAHPDESLPQDEDQSQRTMLFTFLTGSAPGPINSTTRFYAWASVG